MTRNLPTFKQLHDVFTDQKKAIGYLVEKGVILESRTCECGFVCRLNSARLNYRCYRNCCGKESSIFKGTFFYKAHLKTNEILHLGFFWLCGSTSLNAELYFGYSDNTIAAYFSYFRELVADSLEAQDFRIGGEGVIVELDESKFGLRKYHEGHRVEGVWVFGGVERTPERKIFLVAVPDRSEDTLLHYIEQHVLPGSVIITDLWRGYYNIEKRLGHSHLTVNHSETFIDDETGAHTNNIEGSWFAVKRQVPVRNRTESRIDLYLLEFIWRRMNRVDIWAGFINALRDVLYLN